MITGAFRKTCIHQGLGMTLAEALDSHPDIREAPSDAAAVSLSCLSFQGGVWPASWAGKRRSPRAPRSEGPARGVTISGHRLEILTTF